MATTPITSRMSPPVETVVDRELDRARKDFMDLVRSTDRQVRRDQGEGRNGSRRDRDGREQEEAPPASRADDAARRARLQAQQPGQQAVRHPLASIVRDPRDVARETPVPRETGTPTARRAAERGGGERSAVMRSGQDVPNAVRAPDAPDRGVSRVVERRQSPPPAPVAERQIDRRQPPGPVVPGGIARREVPETSAAAARGARALDAASLVMPTAAGDSLALVAPSVGLPPSPWRLSSETPPEIARRIAHFMRTGELDRSPVSFAPPSPVADPAVAEVREAIAEAPTPKFLPPFAQASGAQASGTTAPKPALPDAQSLFGAYFDRQLHPDRRVKQMAIPVQASVLAATARALDLPHVEEETGEANPFFEDYESKARDRRKREAHAVVEALRRREDD